ncbi:hypothetical protein JZU69_05165 [bacterium]|nr:hypothetical protein [bacterium]
MRKNFGIAVIVLGLMASGFFVGAGMQLGKAGNELTTLRSRGGESVAEHYYQVIGHYGIAYSSLAYALGLASLSVSLGLGGLLIGKE